MVDRIKLSFFSIQSEPEEKKEKKKFQDPRIPGSVSFRPFGEVRQKNILKSGLRILEVAISNMDPQISYNTGTSIYARTSFIEGVIASNNY